MTELTIIGGGPTGLAAAFRAGMHAASVRVIDAAGEVGGQVSALYPEKPIYDVFGFPRVLGRELVRALRCQSLRLGAGCRLGERVLGVERRPDGSFEITTDERLYPTRAVVLATGIGRISPRRLDAEGAGAFEGRGVEYVVRDPASYAATDVALVGGGDSALDWTLELCRAGARVTLIHRFEELEGHESTARQVIRLAEARRLRLLTSTIVAAAHGRETLEAITLRNARGDERRLAVKTLLPMIGFQVGADSLASWGLALDEKRIVVDSRMATSVPGVFAAGDAITFPGKVKLIATGFAEAAVAVKSALEHARPGARLKLPYSSVTGPPRAPAARAAEAA